MTIATKQNSFQRLAALFGGNSARLLSRSILIENRFPTSPIKSGFDFPVNIKQISSRYFMPLLKCELKKDI